MVHRLTQRETGLAVAGLLLVLFLVSLDQTVVGTAMPTIIAELQGFELYAWVTTAYLLAETAVIPIVGKLGDLYGRKWITVIGVAIFLLGSILCGIATSMPQLIVFRGLQGLGGGMLLATVFTLIADIFPDPAKRAKYQGLFFAVFAVSSVIGPSLGGIITDRLDWRWVFYVNAPIGIAALAVLPFVLPQGERRPDAKIDVLGAIAITVSIVTLLIGLSWVGEGQGWTSPRVVISLAVAALAFAVFIPIELRSPEPIIPFSLFRNRTLTTASMVLFMVGIAMFGIILYTPLFVQGVLGRTASGAGAVLTPLVLTMTVMGIIGGQLIARVGRVKPFLLFGTTMMMIGVFLLTTLDRSSSGSTVALFLFVTGLGLGLVMPTTTLAVQTAVDRKMLGVATSATQFIRSVGATVGTAIIGTFVTSGYINGLQASTPQGVPEQLAGVLRRPDVLVSEQALQSLSQAAATIPDGDLLVETLINAARTALAGAINQGFFFVLGAAVLAFIGTLFMPDLRIDEKPAVEPVAEATPADGSAAATTLTASATSVDPSSTLAEIEHNHEPVIVERS